MVSPAMMAPMTTPFEIGVFTFGDPEQVAEKLIAQHQLFGHQRALFQVGLGTLPHAHVLRAIELLGTEVAPRVRAEVGSG